MHYFVFTFLFASLSLLFSTPLLAGEEGKARIRVISKTEAEATRETYIAWSDSEIEADEQYQTIIIVKGKVQIRGQTKNLVILGGETLLDAGSRVEKRLIVLNGRLKKHENAEISDQVLFELPDSFPRWLSSIVPFLALLFSEGAHFLSLLLRGVLWCLMGALLFVIAPNLLKDAEERALQMPMSGVGWFVAAAVIFIPGILALIVSIVGILLVPAYLMVFAFIFYFCAFVLVANILGQYLPPKKSYVMPPLRFFYGVFILMLIEAVPYVGSALIYLAMIITGGAMAAVTLARLRGRVTRSANQKA